MESIKEMLMKEGVDIKSKPLNIDKMVDDLLNVDNIIPTPAVNSTYLSSPSSPPFGGTMSPSSANPSVVATSKVLPRINPTQKRSLQVTNLNTANDVQKAPGMLTVSNGNPRNSTAPSRPPGNQSNFAPNMKQTAPAAAVSTAGSVNAKPFFFTGLKIN